jgi:hypothetical protein
MLKQARWGLLGTINLPSQYCNHTPSTAKQPRTMERGAEKKKKAKGANREKKSNQKGSQTQRMPEGLLPSTIRWGKYVCQSLGTFDTRQVISLGTCR